MHVFGDFRPRRVLLGIFWGDVSNFSLRLKPFLPRGHPRNAGQSVTFLYRCSIAIGEETKEDNKNNDDNQCQKTIFMKNTVNPVKCLSST